MSQRIVFNPQQKPAMLEEARQKKKDLLAGICAGHEFTGWLKLPSRQLESGLSALEEAAEKCRSVEALVVVGIGGSYLGARAAIEALQMPFSSGFPVYFAGHHMDSAYHQALLAHLKNKKYAVNVISKSGTTTEPGIAFRHLFGDLKQRFPVEYKDLIIATTDGARGALKNLARAEGLRTFVIPDDVGGRFSVLTPVGLLPIAASGLDIKELLLGAREMEEYLHEDDSSSALEYASFRNECYRSGKKVEILASWNPALVFFQEWWKQLFGESEGKSGRGIFPASACFSTDLHSLGQWIQDGERQIFETVLEIQSGPHFTIPVLPGIEDGLAYLEGKSLQYVNEAAIQGTREAHQQGLVPVARLLIPDLSPRSLGALFYFFEFSCAISALMLGVNPFDQPGVEAYKSGMFRLLGKPV